MNRFQIVAGREQDFEAMWRQRESHLNTFEGFRSFSLLRNDAPGNGTTEYVSHTVWGSRGDFEAWRSSQQFAQAHGGAGSQGIMAGPPQVALYDAVIEEENQAASG